MALRDPKDTISIFWIAPQFLVFGVSEMFTAVGLIEFFYKQSVEGMQSFLTAMTFCSYSFGFYLSSLLVSLVNKVTSRSGHGGWLSDNNLNNDRLDLFYWLLAGLSFINFFNYLFWTRWYCYNPSLVGRRVSPSGAKDSKSSMNDIEMGAGDWLGIAAPPPFSDPTAAGNRIMGGVNYASAAGGILDETGQHYGDRYSLNQQVVNFETTLSQLRTMMSPENLNQLLANSIVVMVFGSNDYINNYLMPNVYATSRTYTPEAFANLLLNRYSRQVEALYSVGLRKFFLPGLGPLGCIPNQLATGQAPPGRCVDSVNQMLGPFNEGLRGLVGQFNGGSHPGATFVYGNTYGVFGDILNNPGRYGTL
ncbi:GDSL esterase/lipase At1g71250-like [Bidens hawaiensis]|uniref:GDSL esterase/lipase At1g71250-like n=1 Tax=Bidens hawaiensis TaxID=980011 RepID=UPI004049B2D6